MEEVEETIGWSIGPSVQTHPMDQCVQCSDSFVAVQYQSCHPGFAGTGLRAQVAQSAAAVLATHAVRAD
jgi:hypothetical protein